MWPRPINDKGLSFNRFKRDKPPKSTVMAVVPVVAHDEKVALGHFNRSEIGFGGR